MATLTPYEVKGNIDYDKVVKEFGVSRLGPELKKRLGDHHMLRRDIFFAHRDLKWVLDEYEKGNKFF
ncbi:MAG: tryptophan--tRNA ligase, partial [Nanoarchaeota archaeon]